jgi:CHAT domain-containing protein
VDEALRLAALDLRKAAPHPVFWAAFIVIGGSRPPAARKAP